MIRPVFQKAALCWSLICIPSLHTLADASSSPWYWPTVPAVQRVLVLPPVSQWSNAKADARLLAQSAGGLAGQALIAGKGDFLVCNPGDQYAKFWTDAFKKAHPEIIFEPVASPWDAVEKLKQIGAVDGYILADLDRSDRPLEKHLPADAPDSVNAATSLAALLRAVIVPPELEDQARAHGLKLLADARGMHPREVFARHADRFSKEAVFSLDPKKMEGRDFAIAHKLFTFFGREDPAPSAYARLNPLSFALGWNGGDEFKTTDQSSSLGHIQTCTDWCVNLLLQSSNARNRPASPAALFDPSQIDWTDTRGTVSYVMSDGDNVQWFRNNFSGPDWWGNPSRGKMPMGWSAPFSNLGQVSPLMSA